MTKNYKIPKTQKGRYIEMVRLKRKADEIMKLIEREKKLKRKKK